jgi:hypothetical protein
LQKQNPFADELRKNAAYISQVRWNIPVMSAERFKTAFRVGRLKNVVRVGAIGKANSW